MITNRLTFVDSGMIIIMCRRIPYCLLYSFLLTWCFKIFLKKKHIGVAWSVFSEHYSIILYIFCKSMDLKNDIICTIRLWLIRDAGGGWWCYSRSTEARDSLNAPMQKTTILATKVYLFIWKSRGLIQLVVHREFCFPMFGNYSWVICFCRHHETI